ncbi:helicase-exonuclease AddAB subunit AddA [Lactococcus kimchii]|uniref:helicase-exonuclease AddAB subunit AddA n=1 Tax=Lactococcus sp. S-13 TaxID=2507158 RepID=UPI001023DF3D|nr:helicase-exonuclease AddAB subunit AddA [Lactococcus sp. S-13]RZI49422.1 helicase-exonuclease AddAB subunit AddA [Lactococcus sp. S-13]
MSEIKLTPEQEEAIYSSGKNILVSASAGSGKTFVMAQRIVEKVKKGVEIDRLFISTFTKKAASELRMRLERDLKKARKNSFDNEERYKLTLALQNLSNADIGTMDSFTQKLTKMHFNRVNIDPNFRILADQTESDLIKQEVFETLVEEYLSNSEEVNIDKKSFEQLIKNFSKDRNISGFQDVVYSVYRFASATENPLKWLENQFLKGFETYRSLSDLSPSFTENGKENLLDFFELLERSLTNDVIAKKGAGRDKANIILDNKKELLEALSTKNFTSFSELFLTLDTDIRVGSSKDETISALKKEFSAQKQELVGSKSKPGEIRQFVNKVKHGQVIEKYQNQALEVAKNLQKFVIQFYKTYLERKRLENAFEYSDIAHFAIEILEENPDIRENLREHYNEIMIDEYQDTSHTQERMLELLSNGYNLFMVGDIKQSIYGFRLADPGLFLEKYKTYNEAQNPNQLIRLKENFRSRGEVLTFTNDVFKHLMNEKLGEMVYGKEEALVQGNTTDYPSELDKEYYPELLLYKENADDELNDESEENISDGEIKGAAQEIKSLIASGVEPKDIAILVRSKSNNNKIEDVLLSYDIPVVLDEGRVDFLKSMEVLVMLDVLRAIDNPLYDLSLVALLRSPLFSFNEDELTKISLQATRDTRFWDKVQLSVEKNGANPELIDSSLQKKLLNFYRKFTGWRKLVNQISIHELLWKIYIETYYFDYVGALKNGEMRQANLQALSIRAEVYENSGYKGLFKFIRLINKFMEQNNDLASVNIKLPQNAVRVMTFHKSKGLEFDYVFLMNLQSRFNERDLKGNVILSRENGLGMKYLADLKGEPEVDTEFPYALVKMETLPYTVNKELKQNAGLSEEMRVLYVAFTRAKRKLYLVGKIKETDKKQALDYYETAVLEQNVLSDKFRKSSKGFQHWLLALQATTSLPMKMNIYTKEDLQQQQKGFSSQPNFKKLVEDSAKFDNIMAFSEEIKNAQKIMTYEYPHQAATELASIQTPSQVKKRSYEKQLEVGNIQPISEFVRVKNLDFSDFESKKITAAKIGSAIHSFMQYADFSRVNLVNFQRTLDEMGFDEKLKRQIDLEKILTLFDTDFGQLLIDNVNKTVKEAPFSMLRTDDLAGEQYIVRGICDGFIRLEDRIVLFDYKTDRFTKISDIAEIKNRYQEQMELYSEALRKAYGIAQVDKYLILLGGSTKVFVEKLD